MPTNTLQIQSVGSLTTLSGSKIVNALITNTNQVGQVTDLTLANGDNTITVPANAVAAVIVPPSGNANVLKIKGVGGDTGITIASAQPMCLSLAAAQTTFIINSGGSTAGVEITFI